MAAPAGIGSMTSRTRMFKTLSVLAASMVAGAFVLDSFKPGVLRSLTQSPILLHARGRAATPSESDLPRWEAVRIVCAQLGARPVAAHVVVDEAGNPTVDPAWRDMTGAGGSPGCLVIRLDVPAQAARFSAAQFAGLRALLNVLDSETDLPVERLTFESSHPRIRSLQDHQ
jgi:hypothetical protein